jgi:hypothetical protein
VLGGEGQLSQQQQQNRRFSLRPQLPWFLLHSCTPGAQGTRRKRDVAKVRDVCSTHFSVLMYSTIPLACSSLTPAMPLL